MKASALFVALTMALGLMATPAAASDGVSGVVQDFFEWSVNAQRETGDAFWRAIYGDSWNPDGGFTDGVGAGRAELVEKYNNYTTTMEDELNTNTLLSNEGFRLYFNYPVSDGCVTIDSGELVGASMGAYVTASFLADARENNAVYLRGYYTMDGVDGLQYVHVTFPVTCQAHYGYSMVVSGAASIRDIDTVTVTNYTAGSTVNAQNLKASFSSDVDIAISYSASQWMDCVPATALSDLVSVDIEEPSRAGSIAGDVYVVNENGEEVVYNDYSVVNETTNIYNDPISGTERPMEDWAYDYIERQYNITLEDGANVTVKYGDENIEIVEGDSIETLNYGSGSSGEGGGEGGGGSGIGDAIASLFTVLGEIIFGLITAIINLATKALDALTGLFGLFGQMVETITGFFGGFTDFLAGVFPFLPEETFTIFNFGLILLVAATVFRKFLK